MPSTLGPIAGTPYISATKPGVLFVKSDGLQGVVHAVRLHGVEFDIGIGRDSAAVDAVISLLELLVWCWSRRSRELPAYVQWWFAEARKPPGPRG